MRLPSDAPNESNRSGNNKVSEAEARVRNVTIIFIDLSDVTPFAFYLELFVCDLSSRWPVQHLPREPQKHEWSKYNNVIYVLSELRGIFTQKNNVNIFVVETASIDSGTCKLFL